MASNSIDDPPRLITLVEIVGGAKTSEATIWRTEEFNTSIGKRTVRLNEVLRATSRTVSRPP